MIDIKFSHKYKKMRPGIVDGFFTTKLVAVIPCWKEDMSKDFIDWDTAYEGGHYELPKENVQMLLLVLLTGGTIWTTIRRWKPDKEEYYKKEMGKEVGIRIEEGKP